MQTQPLFPTDPFTQPGAGSLLGTGPLMTRALQKIRLEHHWLAGQGAEEFGTNDSDINATFAFPFFYNQQTPLLVTPGFAVHLWDGPHSTSLNPADPSADLPPRAFDAYLDAAWNPQVTPWLGGELGARVGVYSDFSKVVTQSIRIQGRGLAVLSFSPSFQVKAGVVFLDRNRVKLLPAGGIVWTPSSDTRFEILFPNPKLARRFTTIGTADWWGYVRGEYGGGAWTVKRMDGSIDSIDYNDLRVAVGLEFQRSGGLGGFFEAGLAFDREILYVHSPADNFRPNATVFLGAGVSY